MNYLKQALQLARSGARRPGWGRLLAALPAGILLALLVPWLTLPASAQLLAGPLGLSGRAFVFPAPGLFPGGVLPPGIDWRSLGGVPISSVSNSPAGSNGRAPTTAQQQSFGPNTLYPLIPPTAGQFGGFVPFGAVPVAGATNLGGGGNVSQNAKLLNWPRQQDAQGNVVAVLRAAQLGAPYLLKQESYPFGSVISPPSVTESGDILTNGANLTYWMPAPYNPSGVAANSYYYSPNAQAVFATQPGQALIIWQKALPTTTAPTNLPSDFGYISQGGGYYFYIVIFSLVIAPAPRKAPRGMSE